VYFVNIVDLYYRSLIVKQFVLLLKGVSLSRINGILLK